MHFLRQLRTRYSKARDYSGILQEATFRLVTWLPYIHSMRVIPVYSKPTSYDSVYPIPSSCYTPVDIPFAGNNTHMYTAQQ